MIEINFRFAKKLFEDTFQHDYTFLLGKRILNEPLIFFHTLHAYTLEGLLKRFSKSFPSLARTGNLALMIISAPSNLSLVCFGRARNLLAGEAML